MARIIPSADPVNESERVFLRALKHGLSDEFLVFSNLSYLHGSQLREGEVDALVVHRSLGLLFIECKGFGVECNKDGRWVRRYGHRVEPLKKSPGKQVKDHARAFVEKLEVTMRDAATRFGSEPWRFRWTCAVAFPLTRVGAEIHLPQDLPREMVFDSTDLGEIEANVRRLMQAQAQSNATTVLDAQVFAKVVREAIYPRLSLTPSLAGRIDQRRREVVRLDGRQRVVIECLADNDRFRVLGGAGTGKSLLALETARIWATEKNRRVLLACFNWGLAHRLRSVVQEADWGESVHVSHFHGIVRAAIEALGKTHVLPPTDAPRAEVTRFWERESPAYIDEALSADKLERYDALIVDEAQDIDDEWWLYLQMCLKRPDDGPLVALYDPDQTVFGRECAVPDLFTLRLIENYRNPRTITEELVPLTTEPLRAHPDVRDGEPVRRYGKLPPGKLVRKLDELVRSYLDAGLHLEEIVLLGARTRANTSLAEVTEIAGHELTWKTDERSDKLLYSTVSRFKGLEAPIVILIDTDRDEPKFDRRTRYVAASRATMALHIFEKGAGWS